MTTTCRGTLAAHGTCECSVVFAPKTRGAVRSSLDISSGGETRTVDLTGKGVFGAQLAASPLALKLSAAVGQSSVVERVIVGDAGEAQTGPLEVRLSGPDAAEFAIMSNLCPGSLLGDATCEVLVVFKPTGAGLKTASLVAT